MNYYAAKKKPKYKKKEKEKGWFGHELSKDQKDAVEKILSTKSAHFISGAAGSGKSTVINYIRATNKKVSVTATTGLAAQLVSGSTLHSFAGLIPNKGAVDSNKADYRIKNTELLIVDEASMMDEWLFLQLLRRFELAKHEPKLLLVGDFLQIPPVNAEPLYKSEYFKFIDLIKLTSYHRQSDPDFIAILNDVRVGIYSDRVRQFIKEKTSNELPDDCTHLMSLRSKVEQRNLEKLNALKGKEVVFTWDVVKFSFDEKDLDKLNNIRMPRELCLKIGARIMMLNNDQERRWVNGSTGVVMDIVQGTEIIYVQLDSGYSVQVERKLEQVVNADDEILFSVKQFPMMLAFASTIHKIQGATLDKVGINLNNHFETALTYVSLSRCKTSKGIYLCGQLSAIKTDMEAVKLFG